MKIYLATSWKNEHYERVLKLLTDKGYEVYDFRKDGFYWEKVGLDTTRYWSMEDYYKALQHNEAFRSFHRDVNALDNADICVLLLPSGRSSHLEAGYAIGQCKKVIIYFDLAEQDFQPDLMYKWAYDFCDSDGYLLEILEEFIESSNEY